MDLTLYISNAIKAFPRSISADDVGAACEQMGISPTVFCDRFATQVASKYTAGNLAWTDADTAMNSLSAYFFTELP